jgi:hypothetical protein
VLTLYMRGKFTCQEKKLPMLFNYMNLLEIIMQKLCVNWCEG